jgi:hypothetical protein
MVIPNKLYDSLKWVAQYLLPGVATLYFALSDVWGLPYTTEIVGSILAVGAFIGACLQISTSNFRKQQVEEGFISSVERINGIEDLPSQFFALSQKAYEIVRWSVMVVIPAAGTLYFALSTYWGFPYAEQVVGSIAAFQIFIGMLLGVSTYQYKKG